MIIAAASGGDVALAGFSALTAFATIGIPSIVRSRRADKEAQKAAAVAAKDAAGAAAEAKKAAYRATETVNSMKNTLGTANGNGDAMTMLAKSLSNQFEMLSAQERIAAKVDVSVESLAEQGRKMDAHILADATRFEEIKVEFARIAAAKTVADATLTATALAALAKLNDNDDSGSKKVAALAAIELQHVAEAVLERDEKAPE